MLKNTLMIFSSNAFSSIMGLVRSLLVARLLSVEQYGVATTFAISMAVVEMMTSLGLHQLIIQDKDGDDPRMQAGLQGFHLLRGCLSGCLLFLLARPIAEFMGTEDLVWAYQALAMIPVLNGLAHFDIYRLQRRAYFIPSLMTSSIPALLAVLLIWPFYALFKDYRVMLAIILAQGTITMIVSHVMAERPYRLLLDRKIMTHALRFGWPLLINNILLFFVLQGEKVIVGRELGLETLAIFAMGFTLTLWPALLLSNTVQSLFLPQLSESKDDDPEFQRLAVVTMQCHLVLSAVFVIGVMLLAGPVIPILLSNKYDALIPLLPWMAILQSLRLLEGSTGILSIARGRTGISLVSNLVRAVTMPLAWYAAATTGSLHLVIWIGTAAELVGLLISLYLVRQQLRVSLQPVILPFALNMAVLVFAAIHAWMIEHMASSPVSPLWIIAIIIGLFVASLTMMKDLQRYIMRQKIIL